MADRLFSLRMRASLNGRHVSGAERVVREYEIPSVTAELVMRANSHERGTPDSITITVDSLDGKEITRLAPLPVTALKARDHAGGREKTVRELVRAGVSEAAAKAAFSAIVSGASPTGGNMRGAMIVDAVNGRRLEEDPARGVRARSVDYDRSSLPGMLEYLKEHGLHENLHFREALALATKVAHAPYAIAELCISDDPGYITGYVASRSNGYVRITPLKEAGDPMGGRAFFVDGDKFDFDEYLHYMREIPVLVAGPIAIT